MNCFGCDKKLDPILTFARPHGKRSKCEDCRKKAREVAREKTRLKREVIFRSKDSEGSE